MQTALSGLSVAGHTVAVVANNLANAQTPGFKASRTLTATQTPQTLGLGAAPSGSQGGTNPTQIGNGALVVQTSLDTTQGTIAVDSEPLNLALQGQGLFILEGSQGERLYTRDGRLGLNADGELISSGGRRVLGFAADDDFQVDDAQLGPLRIPLGRQIDGSDGQAATMTSFHIDADGRIRGMFSDGSARDLGQIRLARFANPSGLQQRGNNELAPSPNSGLPIEAAPGQQGVAAIFPGGVEQSNTDIGGSLIDLAIASDSFSANLAVIGVADEMLDELIHLGRA